MGMPMAGPMGNWELDIGYPLMLVSRCVIFSSSAHYVPEQTMIDDGIVFDLCVSSPQISSTKSLQHHFRHSSRFPAESRNPRNFLGIPRNS